ncbi:MAG: tRNA (adenosine(37)-N6)-dimethylallyltransferase MiaA [Opitutales bacterium]|nr:tRNA (adenosine(37)-N6)-dimethylallyltransferase MiaA [Opitutales bacterium]
MSCLYFIIGPTAVGKSELSLRWAERHGAEILYCDAFCVYRGMDIGTAKPDRSEQARVPHHGIDIVNVDTPYTVGAYVDYSRGVVEDCARREVPLLISGGSGFYTRSFFAPVTDSTETTDEVRARVRSMGSEEALAELRRLNPDGIQGLDLLNPRRVQSALERCMASGKPLAVLQKEYREQELPYAAWDKRICLLMRDREVLNSRIGERARLMLQSGLVDEVRRLRGMGFERNPSAASAIGYRETLAWLDSGESGGLEALAGEIAQNTRKLVKKQLAFFRNQLPPARVVDLDSGRPDLDKLFE